MQYAPEIVHQGLLIFSRELEEAFYFAVVTGEVRQSLVWGPFIGVTASNIRLVTLAAHVVCLSSRTRKKLFVCFM